MSLKKESNIFRTFAFRLAIWHTVLFAIFLIIIFSISYKILVSSLRHTVDRALLSETTEIEEELGNVDIENVKLDIQEGIKGEGSRWNFYRLLNFPKKLRHIFDHLDIFGL